MIKPGIQVCAVNELQPVLRALLMPLLGPDDPVQLCMMKFWDGKLSAFVITDRKALLASWDTLTLGSSAHQEVASAYFSEIATIKESVHETPMMTRELCIELWGSAASVTPLISFPFLHHDTAYQEFYSFVQKRIAQQCVAVPRSS